jgi:hypothetical protein
MKAVKTFNKIVLQAPDSQSYPQGYNVYVSNSGTYGKWVAGLGGAYMKPGATTTINLSAATGRYITIAVDKSRSNPWKVGTLKVYNGSTQLSP